MKNRAKSLYIHIPFCETICYYCDFPKLQYFTFLAKDYLKKLKEEIDSYRISEHLETIYIGGGTPTSLEDDLFEELLKMLLPYATHVKEYTCEANPENLTINKLKLMKRYGVNRISIGVESTNEEILKSLNRKHTFLTVKNAISNAKSLGFDNLNVDLILGLPHVSNALLKKDLLNLLELDVPHISTYSLTVHPHTVFGINKVREVSNDVSRNQYDIVEEIMLQNGFIHYEISNFAKPGFMSKHNFSYWNNEHYFGVGLGASGYLENVRYTNTKSINDYLSGKFIKEEEKVSKQDEYEYYVMLTLRTNIGLDFNVVKQNFGIDVLYNNKDYIDSLIKNNLAVLKNDHLILTYSGMMVLDSIVLNLI